MGNNKRVLKAIDRELKDRYRSKRYSKSLSATNSLFAPNYLFSKPSKRRIYNPNAKYFDHGGVHGNVNPIEGDLYSKVLMNRNRGVGFVDRAFALGENPGTPLFNIPDNEQFGSYMSHKMAYGSDDSGQTWMYPTILNDADEAIKVPNQYADYISSEGYKNATGMVRKHGGPHGGPGDPPSKYYDKDGNLIEDVPSYGTIYTSDPNDPRIQEFKDRLHLYNLSKNNYLDMIRDELDGDIKSMKKTIDNWISIGEPDQAKEPKRILEKLIKQKKNLSGKNYLNHYRGQKGGYDVSETDLFDDIISGNFDEYKNYGKMLPPDMDNYTQKELDKITGLYYSVGLNQKEADILQQGLKLGYEPYIDNIGEGGVLIDYPYPSLTVRYADSEKYDWAKPVEEEPKIEIDRLPVIKPELTVDASLPEELEEGENFNNDYKAKRVVDKETHYKVNKKGKIRRGPFGKKTTRRVRYELPEEEQLYPEGFVPRFSHGGPHDPPEKKSIITNKNNPNYVYKDYAKKYGVDLNSISAEDIEALIKNQRAVQDYWQNQQNLYKPLTSAHTAVGIMLKPEDRNDYLRAVSKYHIIPGNKNYLDDIDGWGLLDYKNLDLSDKGIRRDDYPKDLQKFIMDNTTDNISYLPQAELAHDDFEHKQGYDDFPLVRVDNRFPISGIPAYQQIDKKCTNCPSVNIPEYDPVMLARLQNQKTLDDWSYEEINDIGEIEVPSDIDPGTAKSGYKPIRRGLQFFKGEKRRNNNAIQKGKGFFGKNKRIKQQGGSIEAELTDKEVERYRAGGYILEEMHEGGEPGHTHDGDPPEKKSKDQKFRERWNLEMKQNQDIDNTFHIVNQRPLIGLDGVDPDAEYNAWIDQNIDYGTNPNKSWITSAYEGLDDLYHLPANLLAEDYSSYSTRDKAFAQARADGETSFMYNGKRFNTRREDDDIKLTFETDDPDEQYVFQHLTDETKKEHPILWNLMNKASGIDEISFDGVGSRWISNFDEKSMQEKNRGYYHEGLGLGDGATIHVGETPFEDGTYERFINVLIAELAHRTGHQPSNNPFQGITHNFKSAYENIKYGDEKRYQIPGTDEFNNHRLVEPGIHMTVRGKMTPAIVKKVQNFLGVEEDGIFGEDTYLTMVDRFKDNELIKQMLEEYAKRNPKDKHPELPISFGEEALWATYLNVLSAHVPELSKSTGSWKPYVETVQNMGKFIIPFTKESFKDRKITDFNIRELQSFLAQQGYELPNSVVYVHERYGTLYDGILGDETKTAFKNYRKKLGYKKQGGSVGLGDEVDEATMQRLKEQGYTFEEI